MLVILLDWSVDLWERRLLIYRHCRRILRRDRGGKKCVFGMNLCLSENFFTTSFFVNRILVLIMIVIFLFNCFLFLFFQLYLYQFDKMFPGGRSVSAGSPARKVRPNMTQRYFMIQDLCCQCSKH